MDLRQIEYFVRVAELHSFSKAAAELGMTQPALSRQVRLLELELKQSLLHRNGRGVESTEAGQRLLAHGKALLEHAERVKEDLSNLKANPSGRVAIGLPPRVAHVLTPFLLGVFRQKFPDGSIAVSEGLSAQVRDWLLSGRVEIALLYDPPALPQLDYELLYREDLLLVGPPDQSHRLPKRVSVESLGNYPMILPSIPNAIRAVVEHACRAKNVRLNIVAEVDAVHTTLRLTAEGHGYTILPRSSAAHQIGARPLAQAVVGRPPLRNGLVLATLRSRQLTRLAEATREVIRGANWDALFTPQRGGESH